MKLKTIIMALSVFTISLNAEEKLAYIFQNHMVLQRNKPVNIWGTGDAGKEIKVSFAGQTKSTNVAEDGRWILQLDPMKANATGQELTVNENLKIKDVLIQLYGQAMEPFMLVAMSGSFTV